MKYMNEKKMYVTSRSSCPKNGLNQPIYFGNIKILKERMHGGNQRLVHTEVLMWYDVIYNGRLSAGRIQPKEECSPWGSFSENLTIFTQGLPSLIEGKFFLLAN